MRIKVEMETKKEHLPLEYRRKILSYLKSAIADYNQDLFEALYKGGHAPKSFCFSIYFLPEVMITNKDVMLHSKKLVAWFTTPNLFMGVHLVNAMMGRINEWSPLADWDNQLKVLSVTKVQERSIVSNSVPFKILSPIVIRDHDEKTGTDWYLTFEDERFEQVWKRNLKTELKNYFNRNVDNDVDSLQLIPISFKKTVVLNYGIYIPCTLGKFAVEGEKYLLEYLYKAGIGSRKSLGFGCLDIM